MKQKSIITLVTSFFSLIFFLIQIGVLKLRIFIVEYHYSDSYYKFLAGFAIALIVLSVLNLIFLFLYKESRFSHFEIMALAGLLIQLIGLITLSAITVFFILIVLGGIGITRDFLIVKTNNN